MSARSPGARALLLISTVTLLVASLRLGLAAPASIALHVGAGPPESAASLLHVLIALIGIVGAARIVGYLGRWVGQPPVMGEIISGLLLGPSLLGRYAPAATRFLFPSAVLPLVQSLAQVGVILFMFIVGIDLDAQLLRQRGSAAVAISYASIVVPFSLGALLALYLYPRVGTADVPFLAFCLFLGISLSITAFPVLARILTDQALGASELGSLALTCAAVNDASAWCLLALIVGIIRSHVAGALLTLGLAVVFVLAVLFVVRPLVSRAAARVQASGTLGHGDVATMLVLALAAAAATDAMGIHALFGAFAVGVCIPSGSLLGSALKQRLEELIVVLFLPLFFALTGMRTQIALLDGHAWLLCGLIILVACVGKVGGSALAARTAGLSWRDSAAVGVLMNTRGLMELVVLNVGLDLGIISPQLFAMLVVMAVATTLMTAPILRLGLMR